MTSKLVAGISIFTVLAFLVYTGMLIFVSWPISDPSISKASQFGDSFGVFASLFSGLAFIGALYAIYLQGEELKLQREEMSKSVATQLRQLHYSLLSMAMQDESLEAVWEEKGEISREPSFKQRAYVNLIMAHWEMQHEHGLLSDEQLGVALAKHMNLPYFRIFWKQSQEHRSKMASASDGAAANTFHEKADQAYRGAGSVERPHESEQKIDDFNTEQ